MNNLRYREDLYAEQILENGFLTKYHVHEMKILVKYFKSKGIKPKERKNLIYEFCEKYIEDFNKVLYFRKINSALIVGQKKHNNLIIIKEIPITKSEVDFINNLDIEYHYKKVVFTLLVQNKINKMVCDFLFGKHSDYNFFGGKKQHYKETFSQSKIPVRYSLNNVNVKNDIHNIINRLNEQGIIRLGNRGRIVLSFIDEIESDDEIALNVTTFDNIGYYLDYFNNENNVIKCECCNELVKKTGKNHRMCRVCWKDHRNKYQRELMQKIRNT